MGEFLSGALLPEELSDALKDLSALPFDVEHLLGETLGDELPLLKRDGGFVRDGSHVELTKSGRCATSRAE